jgi:DNA-binding transcriptional LysR family regulator
MQQQGQPVRRDEGTPVRPGAAAAAPSAMNLRFVEAFHWAVTLKSVTRAAHKLCVTQSALSSRIAALESELGVLLFDRRDKQFSLTAAGVRFQRHAERLLNVQREIKEEFGNES